MNDLAHIFHKQAMRFANMVEDQPHKQTLLTMAFYYETMAATFATDSLDKTVLLRSAATLAKDSSFFNISYSLCQIGMSIEETNASLQEIKDEIQELMQELELKDIIKTIPPEHDLTKVWIGVMDLIEKSFLMDSIANN